MMRNCMKNRQVRTNHTIIEIVQKHIYNLLFRDRQVFGMHLGT